MLPPQVLCALARYYGVSVDYLLGETDVRALSGGEKAVRDGSTPFKPSPRGEGIALRLRVTFPFYIGKKAARQVSAGLLHPFGALGRPGSPPCCTSNVRSSTGARPDDPAAGIQTAAG